MHQLVHDESHARHVAGILHEGDESVEYEDVGQEDNDASHASYHAVEQKVFQRPGVHVAPQRLAEPGDTALQPVHRVLSQGESAPEHQPHHQQEDGEAEELVGHNLVDDLGRAALLLLTRHESFAEGTAYEAVFLVGDDGIDVFAEVTAQLLAGVFHHFKDVGVRVGAFYLLEHLGVLFQQLYGYEARCGVVSYGVVGLYGVDDLPHGFFHFRTHLYVDVAHVRMFHLIDLDDSVEELVDAAAGRCRRGNHRDAEHLAQQLVVKHVGRLLQLVVHVEVYHHAAVHVYELGGEVEVAFQVGGHHHVHDHVGRFLAQVAHHVFLLGGICRYGVSAGEVHYIERVTLVMDFTLLCGNSDAGVVPHMLV